MGIIEYLRNEVIVDVSKDVFTFHKGSHHFSLQTFLVLSDDGKNTIFSVGAEYGGREKSKKVLLFSEDAEFDDELRNCFYSFLKYGLSKVIKGWSVIVRPTVIYRSHFQLSAFIKGDVKIFLQGAAKNCGAQRSKFVE